MVGPDPVLGRLKSLYPNAIDLSLDRMRCLLSDLGHPEAALPPVFHVAGTNGKGSTVAFLRAMLEAAGLRVHVYTSPHLVRFNERVRLAGRLIEDDHLSDLLEEVERINAGRPVTFFETTTAAAFLAFARTPADALLLEVGLGGRLDATNVVERPAVTVVTRISLDHTEYLGETIEPIAAEKAGILKPGVPAVFAPQPDPAATRTLESVARAVGAPMAPWSVARTAGGFSFVDQTRAIDLPPPGLPGAHQIVNAGNAIAALGVGPFAIPDAAVRAGLVGVRWPARLQRLRRGRLVERVPADWEVWLDGGHNDSAGEVLAAQAAQWAREVPGRPLLMIFGMLRTKRPAEFLRPLAPHVRRLRGVSFPAEDGVFEADTVAARAREAGIPDCEAMPSIDAALASLVNVESRRSVVLICGSLSLARQTYLENGTGIDD